VTSRTKEVTGRTAAIIQGILQTWMITSNAKWRAKEGRPHIQVEIQTTAGTKLIANNKAGYA
jgi:hypothetical protein